MSDMTSHRNSGARGPVGFSRRSLMLSSAAALGLLAVPARAQQSTPSASPASSPASDTAGTRVITSPMGDVTITGTPDRVVAIEWNLVEYVLALGVQPVAIADIEGYEQWVTTPVELASDVADVGLRYEPSLESIAAAEPDLILGTTDRDEAIYDQLSKIAPTLLLPPYPTEEGETPVEDINETLRTIATALNREAEATRVIAHMEATLADGAAAIEAAGLADRPFILAQAFTSENVPTLRLFTNESLFGFVLTKLGLENSWEGEPEPWGFNTVTVEALVDAPPETLFFYVVQDNDNIFTDQLQDDPIWTSLPFVQEGHTYSLGGDTWTFGGHLSVERLVTKVVEHLAAAE
jgi:ABC-type Fe3+-hydroxamate transport system substrate-binding protein